MRPGRRPTVAAVVDVAIAVAAATAVVDEVADPVAAEVDVADGTGNAIRLDQTRHFLTETKKKTQIVNELPQPQLRVALGLWKTNPWRISSS